MKKRYILFGYQIQNGEFCIVQQEGAAVEYIFDAYSNGDSLQQIATHMSSCGPPYRSSDNRWNKNIIARLLSCDIYCGTATYPAIITNGRVCGQCTGNHHPVQVTNTAVLSGHTGL